MSKSEIFATNNVFITFQMESSSLL